MISRAWIIISFLAIICNFEVMTETVVVIIGAGLSGISAASKLIGNGHGKIIILEAEKEIGGRVKSVPFGEMDGYIDLGAQWVHGEEDNVIYETVHEYFNLSRPDFEGKDYQCLSSNGQVVNQEHCGRLNLLSKEIMSIQGQNISFGNLAAQKYKEALKGPLFSDISNELADQMLKFFEKKVNVYHASQSWFDISILYENLYSQDCEGHQTLSWKKEGFRKVFDVITKKFPDSSKSLDVESKIQFNKEVVNIHWNPNQPVENITITCSDGSTYSADHLIFTASLGVLKARHQTLFTPSLPANKIKAIENIGFGAIGKIFLEFEKPFWSINDKELVLYELIWTEDDLQAIKGTEKEWLQDLVSFIRVDDYPRVLEAFVGGKRVKDFEKVSDAALIDDVMWLLEKFLSKPLPRPTNMKRSRWLTSRNFLGSYSYLSMDSERTDSKPEDLAEPLLNADGQPKILFAGEATDKKHSSFSNGAVASGWRAADELLTFFRSS